MDDEAIPEWDISPLVRSTESEDIKKELSEILEMAKEFQTRYKGPVKTMNVGGLRHMLEENEDLLTNSSRIYKYCYMNWNVNAGDTQAQALNDFSHATYAQMEKLLAFMEVEIGNLLTQRPEILIKSEIEPYKHYLSRLHEKSSHMLSEEEEQIVIEKNRFGSETWSTLQGEIRATSSKEIEIDGEKRKKALMQLFQLTRNSTNRNLRRRAAEAFYEILNDNRRVLAYAYRSISGDYITEMKLRGWPNPLAPVLHTEGLEKSTIEDMHRALFDNVPMIRRYFSVKSSLLGVEQLGDWDLSAPLSQTQQEYTWTEARKTVVDAYRRFDSHVGAWVDSLFQENKIHAKPTRGKVAFGRCCSVYQPNLSWIVVNFSGALSDLINLAHEAGHGYHSHLSAHLHPFTTYHPTHCLGETASTFGELLLLDALLINADENLKIQLLCRQLDNFRLLTFDMLWRFMFETRTHNAIESGQFLDAETIARLWVESRTEVFGNGIDWLPNSEWMWGFIIHNFIPGPRRYYNFSFSFGELLVFALYSRYREKGDAFKPEILNVLKAGGSASPREIVKAAGFDINSRSFWNIGIGFAENLLAELENLIETP